MSLVPVVAHADSVPLAGEVAELWSERPRGEDTLVVTAVDAAGRPKIVATDGVDTTAEVAAVVAAADRLPGDVTTEWDGVSRIVVSNDALRGSQWGHDAMAVESSWSTATGAGVVVAVVDSGVSAHPDLATNLLPGRDFVDGDTNASDLNGHGTHVAGIVAADADNTIGVAGAAPDAKILPVRVLDASGSGSNAAVAQGITWAVDNGADVINLSLGSTTRSSAVTQAVAYAVSRNVVVVAAAGNGGDGALPSWPGAEPDAIGVAATTSVGTVASFSTRGSYVDVAAAGQSIISTLNDGTYGYMSGTSMASPYVAALAALVVQANPQMTVSQVRDRIQSTAVDMAPTGLDNASGFGQVSFAAAVPPAPWNAPAPSTVTTSFTGLDVAVSASTVSAANVSGYHLLRDGAVVGTSLSPSFLDAGRATVAGTYVYGVRAFSATGALGAIREVTLVVAPPSAPTLAALVTGSSITVTPAFPGSVTASGWMAYRNGVLVATISGTGPTTMSSLGWGNYSLTARAIGSAGVSGLSALLSVDVLPPAPTVTVARSGLGLTVNATAVAGASRYEFSRNGSVVANITSRDYVDASAALAAGSLSYSVRAQVNGLWTQAGTSTFVVDPPVAPQISSTTSGSDLSLNVVAPGSTELLVYRDGVLFRTVTSTTSIVLSGMAVEPYAWTVRGARASGVSAPSNTVLITTGISVPSTITAVRSGMDVVVTISAVPSASRYEWYRNGVLVASSSRSFLRFIDASRAGVAGEAVYQVRAVSSSGMRSAFASTTWAGVLPSTPVVSGSSSQRTVTLVLTAPGATELMIYRNGSLIATRPAAQAIVLTNQNPGTYNYSVRSATAGGVSAMSAPVSISIAKYTPVVTVSVDRTELYVYVDPIPGAQQYVFYRDGVRVATTSGSLPRYWDPGRAQVPGRPWYGVVAVLGDGSMTPMGTKWFTVETPVAPGITASVRGDTVTIATQGVDKSHRVLLYVNGSVVSYGRSSGSITLTRVRPGTYTYAARTVSVSGSSEFSTPVTITVGAAQSQTRARAAALGKFQQPPRR